MGMVAGKSVARLTALLRGTGTQSLTGLVDLAASVEVTGEVTVRSMDLIFGSSVLTNSDYSRGCGIYGALI
jgi:hypothetical protein